MISASVHIDIFIELFGIHRWSITWCNTYPCKSAARKW